MTFFFQLFQPTPFPAPEREMDEYLKQLMGLRNGPQIGAGLLRLMRMPQFSWLDLYLIEERLRHLDCEIYLVAAPMKFHDLATDAIKSRPLLEIPPGDLDHFLWVEVNGREKMLEQLKAFGIESYEANLENLKRTGFLRQKSN